MIYLFNLIPQKIALLFIIYTLVLITTQQCLAYDEINKTYFPPLTPPSHLYVASIWASGNSISMDANPDNYYRQVVMLGSLSGILLQQGNTEGVFIEANTDHRLLLQNITTRRAVTYQYVVSPQTPWTIVNHFKASFGSNYVLYNLNSNPGSLDVARMAAYKYNAIMVDSVLEAEALSNGLTKVFDCSTMDDQWIYNNWWPTWARKDIAIEQTNLTSMANYICMDDYAAAVGAVAFYFGNSLDTGTPSSLLRKSFLNSMEADSPLMGWGDFDEISLMTQNSQYNITEEASNYCFDLALFSAYRDTTTLKQYTHSTVTVQPNTHYVCFLWTDGDNVQWFQNGFITEPTWWGDSKRGLTPMGWGITPSYRDMGHTIVEYLYSTASTTPQGRDNFVAMSPIGYCYPSLFTYSARSANAARLNQYMSDMDFRILTVLDNGAFVIPQIYQPYLAQPNIDALFYWDVNGNYAKYAGAIEWVNNKPIISASISMWSGLASPVDVANYLNSQPADPTIPAGYSLVPVHAWSMSMDSVMQCVSLLNSNVKVVTPEEFVNLIVTNVSTSSNSYSVSSIDIDLGNWQRGSYVPIVSGVTISTSSNQQEVDGTPSTKIQAPATYASSNMNFSIINVSTSGSNFSFDIYGDGSGSIIRLEFYSSFYGAFIYYDITMNFTGWQYYQLTLDGSNGLLAYGATFSQVESSINIFQVAGSWNSIPATIYLDNVMITTGNSVPVELSSFLSD